MRALPLKARWYLIVLWCAAIVVALSSLFVYWQETIDLNQIVSALIFVAMLTIADLIAFQTEDGRTISIAIALLIASLTALNWPLVLIVILLGTFLAALAREAPWWQAVSNIALRWLSFSMAAGIAIFAWNLVRIQRAEVPVFPYTTLPALLVLLLMGALIYLVERSAETILAALSNEASLAANWRGRQDDFRWHVLMLTPLGGLLAALWQINGWAFILGIVPVVIVQQALRSQIELNERSVEVQKLAGASDALNVKLERLQSISIALIATRDVPTMLKTLCDQLAALMDAEHGWVVLTDEGSRQPPHVVASYNLPIKPETTEPQPVPWPQSYEPVLNRSRVVVFTDQRTRTLAPLMPLSEGEYWKALVFIPLADEKRVLGGICLTFPEIRGLSESEQRILTAFARQAATVIRNANLFRQVQESQAELIQSSKLAAVGTFASGIAHEFNNLLAGMLGYAQLGLSQTSTDIKNESLQIVVDTCKRGKSITGSLLTFGRRRESRRELADICEAVQGTLTLMELELRKFNITIERYIYPVQLTVCDTGQISQVFLNLLTNARDAMKPDGGTLTVSLTSGVDMLTLAVSDTGSGIPNTIRDKIFEPFVTTKGALGGSQTPGTGLGLSVSYGIVKSHNGEFEVESTAGQGTTMTVRIPIVNQAQALVTRVVEPEAEQVAGLRLLVVDDDVSIAKSLKGLLERTGHHVVAVTDGDTALDTYRTQQFDVVLTDLNMPGMNGIELLEALRVYDPDVPMIALTGRAGDDIVTRAMELGATSVLRKPVELHEIIAAIKAAWMQRRSAEVVEQ